MSTTAFPITEFEGEREIPLSHIRVDNDQIRFELGDELQQFASDLEKWGMLSPITVVAHGDHYRLICGERRFLAAELAGFATVPAKCLPHLDEIEVLEVRFQENQRQKRMTKLEIAMTTVTILEKRLERDTEAVSALMSRLVKRETVDENDARIVSGVLAMAGVQGLEFYKRFLPLLKLDTEYVNLIKSRKLSERKALIIRGIPNEQQRRAVLKQAIEDGLTVQQLESIKRSAVQVNLPKPGKRQRVVTRQMKAVAKSFHLLDDNRQNEVEALMRKVLEISGVQWA
jgi:ParB family transcriptional regulator, chromosome partitioning protein